MRSTTKLYLRTLLFFLFFSFTSPPTPIFIPFLVPEIKARASLMLRFTTELYAYFFLNFYFKTGSH